MIVTLTVKFVPQRLSLSEAYAYSAALIENLGELTPDFRQWWGMPKGPKDHFVSFVERSRIIARMEADDAEFPELRHAGAPGLLLTNAGDEASWRARGRVGLAISPSFGSIRISISDVEVVFERPSRVLWTILDAMSKRPDVCLIQTNVKQRVGADLLLYSLHRAPSPHREFLGWMGYVDEALTRDQVPAAAKLERRGNGTLILATDVLDLSDPHAVQQANQVEMSLVDLGLLPVIDPALK